jgi:hypothetical protein
MKCGRAGWEGSNAGTVYEALELFLRAVLPLWPASGRLLPQMIKSVAWEAVKELLIAEVRQLS